MLRLTQPSKRGTLTSISRMKKLGDDTQVLTLSASLSPTHLWKVSPLLPKCLVNSEPAFAGRAVRAAGDVEASLWPPRRELEDLLEPNLPSIPLLGPSPSCLVKAPANCPLHTLSLLACLFGEEADRSLHRAFPSTPELGRWGGVGALGLSGGPSPWGLRPAHSPARLGLPHHWARSTVSHQWEQQPTDLYFFIKVKFTRHRINHLKVDASTACGIFMTLCDHHLYLVPEYLYPQKETPSP